MFKGFPIEVGGGEGQGGATFTGKGALVVQTDRVVTLG